MLDFSYKIIVAQEGEYKCSTFTGGSLLPYEVNTSLNHHRRIFDVLIDYSMPHTMNGVHDIKNLTNLKQCLRESL